MRPEPTVEAIDTFEALRASEFGRLDELSQVYLDYTGSGIYAESQIRNHAEFLSRVVLGNPHSENPASALSTRIVDDARAAVLEFFDADPDEYFVCFTANASAALKLVGEAYPFAEGSRFLLTADNHNSVNGIREYAAARGAAVEHLPLSDDLRLADDAEQLIAPADGDTPSLFAFPAQSNFSGVQHSLSLVEHAQRKGYDVALDAAAFVATNRLSLREVSPEFVCVSFYKMFGYPTGVGALIARREALARLRRPWFAGGTVEFVSVQNRMHQLYEGPLGFEDGTPNFIDIAAVRAGLDFLRRVGVQRIHDHVGCLTEQLLDALGRLAHSGGAPLVRLYGPRTAEQRGGTIAFGVLDAGGREIFFETIETAASEVGISVRGGCFCNPGASEAAFKVDPGAARRCLESFQPGEFTPARFSECLDGLPVGAVRTSLGIASNEADIQRLVEFLAGYCE
jgi:selenocysteine lyase/cysteine desulfurase